MKIASGIVTAAVALSSCSQENDILNLLVGTYTGEGSEGVYVYQFDQNRGVFVSEEAVGFTEIENPSFLTVCGEMVYAVSEKSDDSASLTSYRFDSESLTFTRLGRVSSEGADPCYVSTNGRIVAVGNYSGGTMAVFPVSPDGAAGNASDVVAGAVGGPDLGRQATPHVHCSVFTPDGKYILATDFSADRLMRYEIETGAVDYVALEPDYGPRHIAFSPDGKYFYVIGELSGDVTVVEYGNMLNIKQVVSADKVDARGAADIHVSHDGRFLYASLRLRNDGIAVFNIGDDGRLTEAGYTNTGLHPRNFTITPNGRFLLCACRDSDSIEVYSINQETGLLTRTDETLRQSRPVCLVWD